MQRWYKLTKNDERELHVFGDASEDACAVAYVVSAGIYYRHVSFAMVKARVAPLKHHTISELELKAAVTATRLKEMLVKEHECNFSGIFMWTDSTTLLQWIRNNDKKQPVFVANKVAEMLDSATVGQRNHIEGLRNPADEGTHSISCPELMESDWLQVPLWLKDENWISHIDQKLTNEHHKLHNLFEVTTDSEAQVFLAALVSKSIDWERFSQFNRLKFMVMRILKMLPKCKNLDLVDLLKLAEFKIWLLARHE